MSKIPTTKIDQDLLDLLLQGKPNYTLARERDGLIKHSEKILWIEWDENGVVISKTYAEPAVGRSLLMSPFNQYFTWLTTPVTEIVEQGDNHLIFQTENSKYELTWTDK